MTMSTRRQPNAFSLIEVTMALGILTTGIAMMITLLPVGLSTNKQSANETMATGILSAVVADLRYTEVDPTSGTNTSKIYQLSYDNDSTIFTDEFGSVTAQNKARYRIFSSLSPDGNFSEGNLIISWPAGQSDPALAEGKLELYLLLDRR